MTSAGSNAIRVPSPCTTRTCSVCAKFAVARAGELGIAFDRRHPPRGADPITAAPAHDVPGAGSEEVLPRHRGEGRLDLWISDAGGRRDLLPIGPPDDLQFALAIPSWPHMAGEAIWPR